jgi:hypothetical protein
MIRIRMDKARLSRFWGDIETSSLHERVAPLYGDRRATSGRYTVKPAGSVVSGVKHGFGQ